MVRVNVISTKLKVKVKFIKKEFQPLYAIHATTSSTDYWSFVSIYRNERALWSKSKTWNKLKSGRFRVNLPFDPPPPFETARVLSNLYAFQYGQWAPIWNSQIIGRYKEIPVHREMVYSFTFYTALYISIVTLSIVPFGVEQVDRSVMHLFLCQISVNFFMILSFVVVVVVVVVVVYYTSGTITTTRFIEIDYEVCVK